jgi:tetratricopeptide (TPR) repeat protein
MAEPDDLFTLKNQLWVGNYRNAISEGNMLNNVRDALKIERDVYVYRAQLGLGNYQQVINAIPDNANTPIALSAIKLYAAYLNNGDKEMIELTLKEWVSDPSSGENPHLLLIAGMIFAREGKLSDALSAFTKGSSLEHMLYIVHLYLQMDRLDLALKQIQEMKKIEEDSTLTQLAHAWYYTLKGGEKADEATLHFQELSDRFGATPLLLNGAAAAFMALKNYVEAERLLQDALQKDSTYTDTLINLIALSAHMSKSNDATLSYILQLQQVAPKNPWLQNYTKLEAEFSATAANIK